MREPWGALARPPRRHPSTMLGSVRRLRSPRSEGGLATGAASPGLARAPDGAAATTLEVVGDRNHRLHVARRFVPCDVATTLEVGGDRNPRSEGRMPRPPGYVATTLEVVGDRNQARRPASHEALGVATTLEVVGDRNVLAPQRDKCPLRVATTLEVVGDRNVAVADTTRVLRYRVATTLEVVGDRNSSMSLRIRRPHRRGDHLGGGRGSKPPPLAHPPR